MIDLHTHTLLSDGELLPSELTRRAEVIGYEAIGITDHCDWSNIDFVVPHIVKVSKNLSLHWKIKVIPGVELTHVPLEEIEPLVKYARANGAKIVVMHGETISEPVLRGTNRTAIECAVDILAHPGNITKEDVVLARKNGVFLEITTRKNHSTTNKHIVTVARNIGAKLLLNTDAHDIEDLLTEELAQKVLKDAGLSNVEIETIFKNSKMFIESLLRKL
jgi:histidinol phosphatase-like PHP family hydrolase